MENREAAGNHKIGDKIAGGRGPAGVPPAPRAVGGKVRPEIRAALTPGAPAYFQLSTRRVK